MRAAALAAVALVLTDRGGFRIRPRTLAATALLGLVGVALMQWSYAMSIERLPVGIALLLEYLGVPVVALVAWLFLGERVRGRLWIAIALV